MLRLALSLLAYSGASQCILHLYPVVILQMSERIQLDARQLRCPMPLLKLKQTLHRMEQGQEVDVLTTDPGSVRDFQAFLKQSGHELLEMQEQEAAYFFRVRKQ
jgi:tRNA 2-thiouridine synthesizing protein A